MISSQDEGTSTTQDPESTATSSTEISSSDDDDETSDEEVGSAQENNDNARKTDQKKEVTESSSGKDQEVPQKTNQSSTSNSTTEVEEKDTKNENRKKFTLSQARKRVLSSDSDTGNDNTLTSESEEDIDEKSNIPANEREISVPKAIRCQGKSLSKKFPVAKNKRRKLEQFGSETKDKVKAIEMINRKGATVHCEQKLVLSNDSVFSDEASCSDSVDNVNMKKTSEDNVAGVKNTLNLKDRVPNTNNFENTDMHVANIACIKGAVDDVVSGNNSPAADTLPSDLTSSSDILVINEDASPRTTPTASPNPALSAPVPGIGQTKIDVCANASYIDTEPTVGEAQSGVSVHSDNSEKHLSGKNAKSSSKEEATQKKTEILRPAKVTEKAKTKQSSESNEKHRRNSKDQKAEQTKILDSDSQKKLLKQAKESAGTDSKSVPRTRARSKDDEKKDQIKKLAKTDSTEVEVDKCKTLQRQPSKEEKLLTEKKTNASKSGKSITKDKIVKEKGAKQGESKSVKAYKEIYSSSSDEYSSSEEEEKVDNEHIVQQKHPTGTKKVEKFGKDKASKLIKPVGDNKIGKTSGSKTFKQDHKIKKGKPLSEIKDKKLKDEDKNIKSESRSKSSVISKPSVVKEKVSTGDKKVEPPKKASLSSYKIPKRRQKTPEKTVENSKEVSSDQKPSTPEVGSILATTEISPLHMTSTCELSPGMMNLLPSVPDKRSAEISTSSPVSTRINSRRGSIGTQHGGPREPENNVASMSDLLTRCQMVFATDGRGVKNVQNANQNDTQSSLTKTTHAVTNISSHSTQGPNSSNLPSVLTSLLSKTSSSSGIQQTSSSALPPALASLLPGTNTKPTVEQYSTSGVNSGTQEIFGASSLPQPLADLIKPFSALGKAASINDPSGILPPEIVRLLPPGVRSISPTPMQHKSGAVESASENASLHHGMKSQEETKQRSRQTEEDNINRTPVHSEVADQTGNQDESSEPGPQLSFGRKHDRRRIQQIEPQERKKPVVPKKKKVTYKGLSDEERLVAYINCGDKNNIEQRTSYRVDRKELRKQKKQKRSKVVEDSENARGTDNQFDYDDQDGKSNTQDVAMEMEDNVEHVAESQVELSGIDRRSQELNISAEQENLNAQPTGADGSSNSHSEVQCDSSTHSEQRNGRRSSSENGKEGSTQKRDTNSKASEKISGALHSLETKDNQEGASSKMPSKRRSSAEYPNNLNDIVGQRPTVRRRSSGSTDSDKSPVNALPPPKLIPDHLITKIPLENSRNAFNVHHHDMEMDPRMKKCLDSESIYSAGCELNFALILPRYAKNVKSQTIGTPVGTKLDPRLTKLQNKLVTLQELPVKKSPENLKSPGATMGPEVITRRRSSSGSEKTAAEPVVPGPEDVALPRATHENMSEVSVVQGPSGSVKVQRDEVPSSKTIENRIKKTVQNVLINSPVDKAQFKTVERSSSFGTSNQDSGCVSPEAKLIDPKLIRHVPSVRKPTPEHRVVVGSPVIKAITTRNPIIKSPSKAKHTVAKEAKVIL